MKTLYDLLGARPHDDAEGLRSAFRKAVKANHPDLHIGDPDAPMRFRQIVQAYDILRDAEQRATYDELLKFEREQLRWTLTRIVSCLMLNVFAEAIAVVSLTIVLGGSILFAYISKTHVDAVTFAEFTARGGAPAKVAAVPPAARADATERDELRDRFNFTAMSEMAIASAAVASTTNDGGAPVAAKAEPAPSSTGLNTEAAKPDEAFDVPIQQADAKAGADRPEKNPVIELPDQERPQSVEVPSASPEKDSGSPEKDNGVAKPASSEFAMSGDEHDTKTPGTADASTDEVRTSDAKMSDARTSDTRMSDTKTADVKISDAKTSDAEVSEAKTSDAKVSDAKTSDAEVSDAKTSDAKVPDAKTSDVKISDVKTPDAKTSDAKVPETKIPARTRMVAKRQATSRTTFERVTLENKNTPACSGSCSDNAPPLFGVGF